MPNTIQNKVMVFAVLPSGDEPLWLALRNNPHPEHGGAKWFVVTGSVENGESIEMAARRELLEETSLVCKKLAKLDDIHHDYTSKFHPGIIFDEQGYLAIVGSNMVVLDIEHIDYKWLNIDDFIAKLFWTDDKFKLKLTLEECYERITADKK